MADDFIAEFREVWGERLTRVGTHYESCWKVHAGCAMEVLLAEIAHLEDLLGPPSIDIVTGNGSVIATLDGEDAALIMQAAIQMFMHEALRSMLRRAADSTKEDTDVEQ